MQGQFLVCFGDLAIQPCALQGVVAWAGRVFRVEKVDSAIAPNHIILRGNAATPASFTGHAVDWVADGARGLGVVGYFRLISWRAVCAFKGRAMAGGNLASELTLRLIAAALCFTTVVGLRNSHCYRSFSDYATAIVRLVRLGEARSVNAFYIITPRGLKVWSLAGEVV